MTESCHALAHRICLEPSKFRLVMPWRAKCGIDVLDYVTARRRIVVPEQEILEVAEETASWPSASYNCPTNVSSSKPGIRKLGRICISP